MQLADLALHRPPKACRRRCGTSLTRTSHPAPRTPLSPPSPSFTLFTSFTLFHPLSPTSPLSPSTIFLLPSTLSPPSTVNRSSSTVHRQPFIVLRQPSSLHCQPSPFSPTTAAARYQNLAINQSKLSGQCGRLKCCLNYELDTYLDALEHFPKNVDKLYTETGMAVLVKTDIFKRLLYYAYNDEHNRGKTFALKVEQVNNILEMNENGEKPENLIDLQYVSVEEGEEEDMGFEDVTGFIELPPEQKKKRRKNRRGRSSNRSRNRSKTNEKKTEAKPGDKKTSNKPPKKKSSRSRNQRSNRRSNKKGQDNNPKKD